MKNKHARLPWVGLKVFDMLTSFPSGSAAKTLIPLNEGLILSPRVFNTSCYVT
ncbi:hypothetical protein [Salinimicrobium marinum]|uniref:hypothetical protein n=1 Tax=Salinimicrobium marinum TaxID=680283 RepID=UPI001677DE48|nr:hypothetical protein [Salinimicrobium marinum]